MHALELLKLFLPHPQGMGVVVDEFGAVRGDHTIEDIVEEILSDAVASGRTSISTSSRSGR